MAGKEDWLDETSFDAVVVGTGMTESAIAAALSRSGRRVLHLDSLPFYGMSFATLQLSQFKDWLGRLSDGAPVEGAEDSSTKRSPWDATEAEIETDAVNHAKLVVEGEKLERDAMNRPIVEDGLARKAFRPAVALKAEVVPRMFSDVSFDEKLPPIQPDEKLPPIQPPAKQPASQDGAAAGEEGLGTDGSKQAGDLEAEGSEQNGEADEVVEGWQELLEKGRQYNIDFTPKLNLSSGKLVAALLQSGVGRYLEFMPLKSTFIHTPGKGAEEDGAGAMARVPMSKADIFQASSISPIEKRLLMKFLQTCLSLTGVAEAKDGGWAVQGVGGSEQEQLGFKKAVGHLGGGGGAGLGGLAGKSLGAMMAEAKLSETVKRFVAHGIALTGEDTSAEEAVRRVQEYALSLGRYAPSAFLACYYGVAEVPQAFCRMGAVYGGVYVLRRTAAHFLIDKETGRASGVICSNGQTIRAPVVVSSLAYVSQELQAAGGLPTEQGSGIRRCVCVCSGPAMGEEGVCLGMLPPGACGNSACVRVLQLDVSAQACPRGKYIWHLWAAAPGPCDLRPALLLLRRLAPTVAVHWCAYYTQLCPEGAAANARGEAVELRPGLWGVPAPSAEVDSGDALGAAERLFRAVAGEGEQYLETMPEPELVEEEPELGPGVDLFQPQPPSAQEQWAEGAAEAATSTDGKEEGEAARGEEGEAKEEGEAGGSEQQES